MATAQWLLQCVNPASQSKLPPEHNAVLSCLYITATWLQNLHIVAISLLNAESISSRKWMVRDLCANSFSYGFLVLLVGKKSNSNVHMVNLIIQTILLSTTMVSVCRILFDEGKKRFKWLHVSVPQTVLWDVFLTAFKTALCWKVELLNIQLCCKSVVSFKLSNIIPETRYLVAKHV